MLVSYDFFWLRILNCFIKIWDLFVLLGALSCLVPRGQQEIMPSSSRTLGNRLPPASGSFGGVNGQGTETRPFRCAPILIEMGPNERPRGTTP